MKYPRIGKTRPARTTSWRHRNEWSLATRNAREAIQAEKRAEDKANQQINAANARRM